MNEPIAPSPQEAPKKLFDRRFTILVGIQIFAFAALLVAILISSKSKSGVNPDKFREVASRLQAAGLLTEAVTNYERFLDAAGGAGEAKASVAFSLGGLYESMGQNEKSLSWYYMVEVFDSASRHRSEASKQIVALLEKLGKVAASKRELKKATSLEDAGDPAKGSLVLAKVGDKTIYLHDLDETIDQLPPQMKETFKSKEEKINLLKKLVADEVLSQKAVRLGLDQKPEFTGKFNQIKKQLLVEKILESELKDKLKTDDSDMANYFEANRAKYAKKESAQVSMIKVKSKELALSILGQLKAGQKFGELAKKHSLDEVTKVNGGKLTSPILHDTPFLDFPKEISDKILKIEKNRWTEPILASGHYTIFFVHSKESAKQPQFNDVKQRIEYDYRMEKAQKKYQELVSESLAGDNIQLFAERVK